MAVTVPAVPLVVPPAVVLLERLGVAITLEHPVDGLARPAVVIRIPLRIAPVRFAEPVMPVSAVHNVCLVVSLAGFASCF